MILKNIINIMFLKKETLITNFKFDLKTKYILIFSNIRAIIIVHSNYD